MNDDNEELNAVLPAQPGYELLCCHLWWSDKIMDEEVSHKTLKDQMTRFPIIGWRLFGHHSVAPLTYEQTMNEEVRGAGGAERGCWLWLGIRNPDGTVEPMEGGDTAPDERTFIDRAHARWVQMLEGQLRHKKSEGK